MLKTVGNPSIRYGNQTILDGNLVIGTAGKGIDFSADPSAPGMTSELLDDYEEGTFTVGIEGNTTPGTYGTTTAARYTKIGNVVTVECSFVDIPVTSAGTGEIVITGLPFTIANTSAEDRAPLGHLRLRQLASAVTAAKGTYVIGTKNTTRMFAAYFDGQNDGYFNVNVISASATDLSFTMTYLTA
jgi:hypothetical protein